MGFLGASMSLVKRNPTHILQIMDAQTTTPADPNHPHYPWGASSAKTWRGCPGSIHYIARLKGAEKIPFDETSDYAEEGTAAHALADSCIKGEITPADFPIDDREHLTEYVELAREIAESNGGDVYHEQQIPLYYNPQKTGTLDYAVVSPELVEILDLKYGEGVWRDAQEDDQLAIYALSLMAYLDPDKEIFNDNTRVIMRIYQPRHRDFDGVPTVWETTYRELQDVGIDIEQDYKRSRNAKPTQLKPSKDACQFCAARKICTVKVLDMFDGIPDEVNPIATDVDEGAIAALEITPEIRRRVFEKHKLITKWLVDLVDDSVTMIEQGNFIEGLKTIDGKPGNRKWSSEEEADKLLRKLPAEIRYVPKRLVSVAQAEKVLKKHDTALEKQSTRFQNRFKELVFRSPGAPKLALAEDPAPARIAPLHQFGEEVTEDDCF